MGFEEKRTPSPPTPPSPATAAILSKLRIAGAWTGALEVDLESSTVPILRAEVAGRSGVSPDCINLICGGKVLKDGDGALPLSRVGVRNNTKVLAIVVSADRGKSINDAAAAEAERSQKLERLRAAAIALAGRHSNGSLPVEDFNIELEDQSGQKVMFGDESDQKGAMMGLMLHANARSLIKKEKYKDALDVLSMGEEAFSLCDPKFIERIDNVPILQLDTVWCYFMLEDISCLSMAGVRLAKARKGFERSHGKDSTRFRLLQDGRHAELAIYLRLELLEAVVAYHSGKYAESRKALESAQAKYFQLQVPDESLSLLMSMGYGEHAAKRALRMVGQDIQTAVDFLVEERAKKMRKREENIQRQNEIMEQKSYGKTAQNKAVDLLKLRELTTIGFEKHIAAEALRLHENDFQEALDLLTDPLRNCALQQRMESQKKRMALEPTPAGFENLSSAAGTNADDALGQLEATSNQPVANPPPLTAGGAAEGSSGSVEIQMDNRDEEMEDKLAKELTGDAFADYDIEVAKEGEAIKAYLALLDSL